MKPAERAEARRLRSELGLSVKRISAEVGASVSSVSRWVRDVELSASQHASLAAANPVYAQSRRGTDAFVQTRRDSRHRWQEAGRRSARTGDPLHQRGCMLFWAEGSKERNRVVFTNSDLAMVELFLRFLRQCHGVSDDRVTLCITCHLGNGLTTRDIEARWLQGLSLPASSLRPTRVMASSKAPAKRSKLPYGTARLAVYSTAIVQSIYGAIQEYVGIERPEWLG